MQITITFIIAISPAEKKKPKRSNRSRKSGRSSDKSSTVATDTTYATTESTLADDFTECGDFICFNVEQPISYVHIEYLLTPESLSPYEIDILCWKQVSKVFSSDGIKVLRNIVQGKNSWIAFSISHDFCLSSRKIVDFHKHAINITVTSNKTRLGKRALDDENEIFYMHKYNTSVKENVFTARFFDCIPTSSQLKMAHIGEVMTDCKNKQANFNDTVDFLRLSPVPNHRRNILDEIKFAEDCDLNVDIPQGQEPAKLGKATGKKGKRGKKGKGKKGAAKKTFKGTMSIKLNCEALFEERKPIFRRGIGGTSGLRYCTAIFTAKSAMTPKQRGIFKPLVIEVRDLTNLPVEQLAENRITHIYASYSYLGRNVVHTLAFPVKKDMTFNDPRTLLLHSVEDCLVIENLQSVPLTVDIYGVRDPLPQDRRPLPFGEHAVDAELSHPITNESLSRMQHLRQPCPKPVLLAQARFDLSDLVRTKCGAVDTCSSCLPPGTGETPSYITDMRKETETGDMNDLIVSRIYTRPPCISPLHTCGVLLDSSASLGIHVVQEIHLRRRLQATLLQGHSYNRIYMELSDWRLAFDILSSVASYNSQHGVDAEPMKLNSNESTVEDESRPDDVQRIEIELAEYPLNSARASFDSRRFERSGSFASGVLSGVQGSNVITGFAIDYGDKYDGKLCIFLEGLVNGYMQNIWLKLMRLTKEQGRVFYNDESVYQQRLYECFMERFGVFSIRLQPPFIDLMSSQMYVKDSPSAETLRRLSMLLTSGSLQSANQHRLFPEPGGLLALRRDHGGPLSANTARVGSGVFQSITSSFSQCESQRGSLVSNLSNGSRKCMDISSSCRM